METKEIVDKVAAIGRAKTARGAVPSAGTKAVRDKRRTSGRDRAVRRAVKRSDSVPEVTGRAHARLGRAKLSKGTEQIAIEQRAATRAYLSKVKITLLVSECPDVKFLAGVPGIKTTWQLSQASTATIHAIPGLGPVRRKKIRAYLIGKRIPVIWEA